MVTMPVEKGFIVTSGFGPRSGGYHYGTDFGLAGGSGDKPVFAMKAGTVTRSGPASGFGRWVTIDHPASNGGGATVYGHIVPEVTAGQSVREGQRIGRIDPNRATNGGVAPHLHAEWHRFSWAPPGPDRLDPMTKLAGAAWPGETAPTPPKEEPKGMTVIDFSAAYPSPSAVKAAGHTGVMLYVSPARDSWMGGKKITRQVVDGYKNAGIDIAVVWQYGAGNVRDSDVMRGHDGGIADARAAEAKLKEVGLDGHPVFFAVDFHADTHSRMLQLWNSTIVKYFRAACEVLGRDRVGIYGASHVVHWAMEDKVVAEVAPGRVLGWITRSWSNGVIGAAYSVLYQRVHNVPGPDGVQIDINDVKHQYWGQRAPRVDTPAPTPPKEEPTVADKGYDIDLHHLIGFGGPAPVPKKVIIVHTTENTPGTPARTIVEWQARSKTGSYHRLVDATGLITLANTDGWRVWATGNKGNDIALHVSCVAQAKMNRAEWLAQPKMLEGVARAIAFWARTYNIPLVKLSRAELGAGKHGVAGHLEAQVWGSTTHWDPGYHFPYDVVLARAKEINAQPSTPTAPEGELTMSQYNELKAQQDRIEKKLDLVLDQVAGPERDKQSGLPLFTGWPVLGGRTLVDFAATLGQKTNIPGCKPSDDGEGDLGADPKTEA